jgi:hypothetical protein
MTKQPYLLASLALATLACTGQVYAQYAPYAPAGRHDAGATTTNLLLTPDRQAQDEQAFFCRPFFRGYSFGYSSFSYGFGGFGYSSFRFYSPGFAYYRPFIGPYFSYYSFGPVFYPISTVVIEQPIVPQVIHPVQPAQPAQPAQPMPQPGQPDQPGQPGQPGQPMEPKFKYDGGPTNPVPLPQPQPQPQPLPKDANPQPPQPNQLGQNVSLPPRPTPRLVYPAYGEHLPRR